MHDPEFLLYDVPIIKLDIWHREPRDRDAGDVCGYAPNHGLPRLIWAARHTRHLRYRWRPHHTITRWIKDRCDDCGRRFRWREARHGYQSGDKVWHAPCMSLRHVRGQLDDLTSCVLGTATPDARWRASYRLDQLAAAADRGTASAVRDDPTTLDLT